MLRRTIARTPQALELRLQLKTALCLLVMPILQLYRILGTPQPLVDPRLKDLQVLNS